MAVWFSDLNNMNAKVRVWLSQSEEEVAGIFALVKSQNIALIGKALRETFLPHVKTRCGKAANGMAATYLPFRLVVAGGDDLCIVMAEKHILSFISNLNGEFQQLKLDAGHPLSDAWLEQHRDTSASSKIPPYCFGGSFVVTPIHTPFRKVHEVGEELMSQAKEKTARAANSVNWRVLGVDVRPEADPPVEFEKPLFIDSRPSGEAPSEAAGRLSLLQYLELADFYRGVLSRSQRQQVISEIMAGADGKQLEKWLMKASSGGLEKGLKYLLVDEQLREGGRLEGTLSCARIATLLELMSIANGDSDHE
jgi:CRISPR/Cas system-associated protein Cas10 (large subunit of type III CRISPR-Cas system)